MCYDWGNCCETDYRLVNVSVCFDRFHRMAICDDKQIMIGGLSIIITIGCEQ